MTFKVFVGYGDVQAKQIAEGFGHYLQRFGLIAFVASTDPTWMLPGHTISRIYQELADSDVLVATCTQITPSASRLGKEIKFARSHKMPILPFLERGITDPFGLSNSIWKMEFELNRPWIQHRTFATYILTLMERSLEARVKS